MADDFHLSYILVIPNVTPNEKKISVSKTTADTTPKCDGWYSTFSTNGVRAIICTK